MTASGATAAAFQWLLLYAMLPLWMLAGFGDWLCHRVQRIEHNTGVKAALRQGKPASMIAGHSRGWRNWQTQRA